MDAATQQVVKLEEEAGKILGVQLYSPFDKSWSPEPSTAGSLLARTVPLLLKMFWISEGVYRSPLIAYLPIPLQEIRKTGTADIFLATFVGVAELFVTSSVSFPEVSKQANQSQYAITAANDISGILTNMADNQQFIQALKGQSVTLEMLEFLVLHETVFHMLRLSTLQGGSVPVDDLEVAKQLVTKFPNLNSCQRMFAFSCVRHGPLQTVDWNLVTKHVRKSIDISDKQENHFYSCVSRWDQAFAELARGVWKLEEVEKLIEEAKQFESKLDVEDVASSSMFRKDVLAILPFLKEFPKQEKVNIFTSGIFDKACKEDPRCEECEATGVKLFHCQGCKSKYYCGRDCQKKDWPFHKQVCKEMAQKNK